MNTQSKNSNLLNRLKSLEKGKRAQKIRDYMKAMKKKAWQYATEPIRYKNDGTIIDGHHRLWAIMKFKSE